MSPRPVPQPITRAARPAHPLARETVEQPALVERSAGLPADRQTAPLSGRQRSERRQDAVFSTRIPVEVKKRLRRHAFENDLLVQDIVTDLLLAYLAEHEA